ncbi:2Fe-2S iron-sulfur cluster-binding protein [Tenacibaculum sp. UWU-22]|uniref:2Fe-2S iron-sulfur cluster-binding protein n=1 Tax=Tenacibaculum sp. UWU-22 TaxID=3234187 RepID=UPI0034DAEB6E
MSSFHQLTIKEIIKETENAVSISFIIPESLKETFSYKPGQYITIKKELEGKKLRRAYSICSSPKSGELKVTVKKVEKGLFSVFAATQLQKGDVLEVHPPEGKFVMQLEPNKNYIAFAAGSGITPVLSMVKTVLESEPSATFTLVYGNKNAEDTIFYNELNQLAATYPTQFNLDYVFSRSNKKPNLFKTFFGKKSDAKTLFGRIDKSIVNFIVKNKYKNITFDKAFLCGPEGMIKTVSKTLEGNGFSSEDILFELFTTATSKEANPVQGGGGETQVTFLLDGETTSVKMQQTDSLLDVALNNNLDAPYSCQGGICSSCMAKIKDGEAVMAKNSILSDAEIKKGYILTCQAHPTTPQLTVDYDDV